MPTTAVAFEPVLMTYSTYAGFEKRIYYPSLLAGTPAE
jgi:hypothetical protein